MTRNDLGATQPGLAPRPAQAPPLDLDTRILQLEQRLIAREAWVRSAAQSLGQRAQLGAASKSWWLPTLGGVAVFWLGWRWWRGRTPAPPVSVALPVAAAEQRPAGFAALPWAGLVALGWPLLPVAWRGRSSPAAATAAVSTGLLIVRWLVGRRAR